MQRGLECQAQRVELYLAGNKEPPLHSEEQTAGSGGGETEDGSTTEQSHEWPEEESGSVARLLARFHGAHSNSYPGTRRALAPPPDCYCFTRAAGAPGRPPLPLLVTTTTVTPL